MFFTAYVLCGLRLSKYKTEEQTIYAENRPHWKVKKIEIKFLVLIRGWLIEFSITRLLVSLVNLLSWKFQYFLNLFRIYRISVDSTFLNISLHWPNDPQCSRALIRFVFFPPSQEWKWWLVIEYWKYYRYWTCSQSREILFHSSW